MTTLRVSEIFGPTLQGEGPSQGQPAWFLRTSGCNLSCSWCDTPYTWDWQGQNGVAFDRVAETTVMTTDEVVKALLPVVQPDDLLVVTGGEPLIQQRALAQVLRAVGARTEVETNGTIEPKLSGVRYNVSPKLQNSGCSDIRPGVLDSFPDGTILKFVVTDPKDFDEIDLVLGALSVPRPVWVMPEGKTREEVSAKLEWVFALAALRGWSVSSRLHVLALGDRRGV